VQAIAKGDRDELAIQAATELGASTVIPWQAQRSISIWANKAERNQARWQQIVDEASKQSLRATFANVLEVSDSKGMRDRIINSEALWLILDPTSTESITQIELPASGEVFLVVGPEGGISESELSEFESAGAKRVHMGQGILRTSTAGLAAIAYLAARTGRWS
jgi:16S rRNA (uracil1498-N3)-methyltransferase